ncbi:MAG TPA: hypothetical protein VHC01_02100 [Gaiellaceae bacterium]|jgi:superfamily II helicase|nr:hypothetical protein [Gaiellaceae bacterium]
MTDELPDFRFDSSPRSSSCEKCGFGEDLRFLIVRGRDRYLGRTLCDTCAEEVLEALILAESPSVESLGDSRA